jgi:putative flippase GtrA
MFLLDAVLRLLPAPARTLLLRRSEFLRFALVGATAFVIDTAVFAALKLTVLAPKPVTAKVIAVLVATVVSYVLNREWSFNTRAGRERHHEAALFFLVSGVALMISAAPLYLSRYGLDLRTPVVSRTRQEIADFVSAQLVGTLLAMVFRWWAFRRYVFPHDKAAEDRPDGPGSGPGDGRGGGPSEDPDGGPASAPEGIAMEAKSRI